MNFVYQMIEMINLLIKIIFILKILLAKMLGLLYSYYTIIFNYPARYKKTRRIQTRYPVEP